MIPLEKATKAAERFSLSGAPDGWRLFCEGSRIEGPWDYTDTAMAQSALVSAQSQAAIRAFLEAAAEDEELCRSVFDAVSVDAHLGTRQAGKAAILTLKETLG